MTRPPAAAPSSHQPSAGVQSARRGEVDEPGDDGSDDGAGDQTEGGRCCREHGRVAEAR